MKNANLLRELYPLTNQGFEFVLAYIKDVPHKWDFEQCAHHNPPAAALAKRMKALSPKELVFFDGKLAAALEKKKALERAQREWDLEQCGLADALMTPAEIEERNRSAAQAEKEVEAQERARHGGVPRS